MYTLTSHLPTRFTDTPENTISPVEFFQLKTAWREKEHSCLQEKSSSKTTRPDNRMRRATDMHAVKIRVHCESTTKSVF